MYNLQCIAQENTLTLEQQNAIDYGISAIKTLADMGIIKSEWEQDHDVLKAYSDGANDALDKVRAEIEQHRRKTQSIDPYDLVGDCLDIIDKYKKETEDT